MHEDWTLLKRLIWLWRVVKGGASSVLRTVTGALLHITDALAKPAHELVAVLSPKQDLHGYDHPWPAGGRGNLFPYPFVNTTKTENGITFTDLGNGQIKVSGTSTSSGYTNFVLQTGIDFGSEYHSFSYISKTYTVDDKTMDLNGLVSGIGGYYSEGEVALRVTAGATVNCTVSPMIYDASSPLTSFVPYENSCPISGWTGANIKQKGKNLLDISNGTEIQESWTQVGNEYQFVLSGLDTSKDYTLSVDITTTLGASGARRLYFYGSGSGSGFIETGTSGHKSLTKKPNTDGTLKITQNATAFNTSGYAEALTKMQLEIGSIMTAFEAPKAGNTLPINWQSEAGTIYSGSFTLNEDRSVDVVAMWTIVDLGSLSYGTGNASSGVYAAGLPLMVQGNMQPNVLYCSHYPYSGIYAAASVATNMTDKSIGKRNGTYKELYVRDTSYLDYTSEQFATAMSGVQVLYPLAEPQTYHFDNVGQLMLFAGENNIWVDASDDLTLTYYADGNVSDLEALNTLLGGMYSPGGDVSDREALNILLGN